LNFFLVSLVFEIFISIQIFILFISILKFEGEKKRLSNYRRREKKLLVSLILIIKTIDLDVNSFLSMRGFSSSCFSIHLVNKSKLGIEKNFKFKIIFLFS